MSATTHAEAPPRVRGALPLGVYLLAFSLFAMGSAEFLLAGVLPTVASDIGVSLATAGGLITAFAVGVVIGGPPFAIISLRWPRRTALAVTQVVFAVSIALGVVAATYPALFVTRFLAGLAYAGFFAVAAATAVSLAGPARAARASGVVVSGLGLAMVLGGPAGTFLGYSIGWQAGFGLVVVLTVVGAVAVALVMPRTNTAEQIPSVAAELTPLRRPRLWLIFAATVLSTGAYMITYNYLAEILTSVTGVPDLWVAVILVVFGVGAWIGLAIGGRISDRIPHFALITGSAGIGVCSLLLAISAGSVLAVVPLVLLLGISGFVLNPAIYGRAFAIASDARTLSGAVVVSAFQLGISLTPVMASLALNHSASITTVSLIGAALAALTIPIVLIERSR
ncbi:MFS transporter [Phytoactinopolyspora limicola]|uniref:MFS transporter n=1 Tax=Phytoactinopolyspora limicola TaxID=2715536 RepID=UPI00140772B1|nr:MFS transporter [Phytoactinopolyspora limicola]